MVSKIKIAAVTPFVSPGSFRQNSKNTLSAVLSAEQSEAEVIVLPKNSFSGDTLDLRFIPDVADATLKSALDTLSKTKACIVVGIAYLGADIALIFNGGVVRCAVFLCGKRDDYILLIARLKEFGKSVTKSRYVFKDVCITAANDSLLNNAAYSDSCSMDSVKSHFNNCVDSASHLGGSAYIPRFAANTTRILAIPAAYPALIGGTERKQAEAAALSVRYGCAVAVACSGAGESVFKYVRAGDKIIACGGSISFGGFDESVASATLPIFDQSGFTQNAKSFDRDYIENNHSNFNLDDSLNNEHSGDCFSACDNGDNEKCEGCSDCCNSEQNNLPANYSAEKLKTVDYTPRYIPTKQECGEVWNILSRGIIGRMRESHTENVILGLSGGLDSTCVLLAAANAQKYGLNRKNIICVTMPSGISSEKTKESARGLVTSLGVTHLDIPIGCAVDAHLKMLNHEKMDVVFENAQARERAKILLNLANKHNALVLGTSDLSEMALGFSTYGGDQLAHYNPNNSLTKSAIRFLIGTLISTLDSGMSADNGGTCFGAASLPVLLSNGTLSRAKNQNIPREIYEKAVEAVHGSDHAVYHCRPGGYYYDIVCELALGGADTDLNAGVEGANEQLKRVLEDILCTPISPELLPGQETEKILGDYALHEYFLLRLIAFKESGRQVVLGAVKTFPNYSLEYIEMVYRIFTRRFFSTRFKTNFACDGVMLTPYDLSGLRLSSDFCPEVFELD